MKQKNLQEELEKTILNHKPLIADLGNDTKVKLTWDNEIFNYRGYVEELKMELGIWTVEYLFESITKDTGIKLQIL